ncbi:hypothetical protein [uncultured Lutibacter sp.]|uniref:hypothetical protein n=1 Tax=uncultured Lutibacter sp. TaxID=437739 RepID=UPI00261CCC02|nr:hypothetical protein [uncultured Lutibacter sp.]
MKFRKNKNYNLRKIHRYLGVFIGIQFLFWTLGGLYFSWNNMDDVHGETLLKQNKKYFKNINFDVFQKGVDSLKKAKEIDSIHSVQLIEAFEEPLIQFNFFKETVLKTKLISPITGSIHPPFSKSECLKLVKQRLKDSTQRILKTEFIEKNTVGKHHEYRGKPLPAFAFTLNHPSETIVYVATELGQITSVRNNNWRRFDFLWMLHTMDYSTRDHITNWVLRVFSVLGIATILSGFYLFYLTSPTIRKIKNKNKK